MKNVYAAAFIFVAACLIFCIYRARKNKKTIAEVVKKLLSAAFLAVAANIVILLSENKTVCEVAYSVFFVCIDWVLYYMFLFTMEFSSIKKQKLVNMKLWGCLFGLDSASMLLNPFFHHAFSCTEVYNRYQELCFKPVQYGAYRVHLGICYLIILFGFIVLIYKSIKSSESYREKYVLVLFVFVFIVIGDATYVFTDKAINTSIIAFAVGGVIIYYYAVEFVPKELLKRTLTKVVQGMPDAILIFDEDGKCIHTNTKATALLETSGKTFPAVEKEFKEQYYEKLTDRPAGYEEDIVEEMTVRGLYLRSICHCLLDSKNNYMGCFFTIQDRTQEVKNLEKERYIANHDALTGIYNKQRFYQRVEQTLQENPGETYLMVCSDIRQFKLINDVFGPEKGDELLKSIADTIREYALPGDIYGRLESDRFGLLMKKSTFNEKIFSEKPASVARSIENCYTYPIRVCVGVYEITNRNLPVSGMCDRAFLAIGTIKDKYGQNVAYYDDALRRSVLREQELTGELAGAIATGQFRIYLQPQISAEGKVLGAEALVRWKHPVKGMISPADFLDVFEKNGSIVKLDRYVWELACRQLAKWAEKGREDLYISINISPKDFYFIDVCGVLQDLVKKYQVNPRCLKLEITETTVMANLEIQLNLIERLRKSGFIVEMDDFGSGYSSLNMLKDIRVDVIKIDMAFLGKTDNVNRAEKILKIIVELSRQLEIPVITEGVETEEQVKFLQSIGCELFQGFYFAKPMEVADFEQKYM